MTEATKLKERLDVLEAERSVLTIELRTALLRAAKDLLPTANRPGQTRAIAKPRQT
jgi:hypothetical protein